MKIALLGYRSHPHVGGQGIYLHYLSKALAKSGHEVTVFSGQPYPELHQSVKLQKVPGMDLYSTQHPFRQLRLKNICSYTDLYEWLSKITGGFAEPYTFCRRLHSKLVEQLQEFDIVHDNQSLGYGLLKLQKDKCTIVATIHHPIHKDRKFAINCAKDRLHRLLVKRWYRFLGMQEKVVANLANIITVSEVSKVDIEEHFPCKHRPLSVIPNGIDTSIFKPLADIKKHSGRIITTASSDQPLKGLIFLLRAIHSLSKTLPEIRLMVIGKLKKGSESAQVIKDLQLEEFVTFRNGISTEELVMEYAKSQLAVCPSLYEGFGIPALEAMACGLPLVSTDGGALPEVVDGAGKIIPAGCASALENAIGELLQSPKKMQAYRNKALARVAMHYSWDKIAEQYSNYYKSIL